MLFSLSVCILTVFTAVSAVREDGEYINILQKRIDTLEKRDAENKATIAALESSFSSTVVAFKSEIAQIRETCKTGEAANVTSKEVKGSKRAASGTAVAFTAIAPDFDFSAMVANKKLIFDTPTTNIGNAFQHGTGTFTAPVRGTYLFFITIGGNIHSSNYFYIDVNGTLMAKALLTTVADQSSNMVIVSLNPNDAVSVKSGRDHDGAYGGFYTTFSGFLLYENIHG